MPTQTTVQEKLDRGSNYEFANAIARLSDLDTQEADGPRGFGYLLASLAAPGFALRDGLTSQAEHKEARPGLILAVLDEAGAVELTIKHVGAPGAGEVLVEYNKAAVDADAGVPTLTFNAAVTGYQVLKIEAPLGMPQILASTAS